MDAELVAGSGGIYDIEVDGEMVYSKFANRDQFPADGQIVRLIQEG